MECFEKARKGRPLQPLQSQSGFEILYQGTSKTTGSQRRTASTSPSRATQGQPVDPHTGEQKGASGDHRPLRASTVTGNSTIRSRSLSPVKESKPKESKLNSTGGHANKNAVGIQRPTAPSPKKDLSEEVIKENTVEMNDSTKEEEQETTKDTSDEQVEEKKEEVEEKKEKVVKIAPVETEKNEKKRPARGHLPKATRTGLVGAANSHQPQQISAITPKVARARPIPNNSEFGPQPHQAKTDDKKESREAVARPIKSRENVTKDGPPALTLPGSASLQRKSVFPSLIENSNSPYAAKQSLTSSESVKLRMTHGASSAVKRTKSRSKDKDAEVNNRGS